MNNQPRLTLWLDNHRIQFERTDMPGFIEATDKAKTVRFFLTIGTTTPNGVSTAPLASRSSTGRRHGTYR